MKEYKVALNFMWIPPGPRNLKTQQIGCGTESTSFYPVHSSKSRPLRCRTVVLLGSHNIHVMHHHSHFPLSRAKVQEGRGLFVIWPQTL